RFGEAFVRPRLVLARSAPPAPPQPGLQPLGDGATAAGVERLTRALAPDGPRLVPQVRSELAPGLDLTADPPRGVRLEVPLYPGRTVGPASGVRVYVEVADWVRA